MTKASGRYGLLRSMGRTGVCWDNAGAESLWSTFKHEHYYRHSYVHQAELVAAVDNWFNYYNTRRRWPDYRGPVTVFAINLSVQRNGRLASLNVMVPASVESCQRDDPSAGNLSGLNFGPVVCGNGRFSPRAAAISMTAAVFAHQSRTTSTSSEVRASAPSMSSRRGALASDSILLIQPLLQRSQTVRAVTSIRFTALDCWLYLKLATAGPVASVKTWSSWASTASRRDCANMCSRLRRAWGVDVPHMSHVRAVI
ncbi:integrase core domain-containing protein [Williamsia muralis]|uniref:integrase core domain-containing protein n=1 Tax=Williamsia marianensis TaxID=85044 RepID=UPI0037DCA7D4